MPYTSQYTPNMTPDNTAPIEANATTYGDGMSHTPHQPAACTTANAYTGNAMDNNGTASLRCPFHHTPISPRHTPHVIPASKANRANSAGGSAVFHSPRCDRTHPQPWDCAPSELVAATNKAELMNMAASHPAITYHRPQAN